MTDVADGGPAGAGACAERCANCGAALHGPFWPRAGRPTKPLDPPVRHFARSSLRNSSTSTAGCRGPSGGCLLAGLPDARALEGRRVPWLLAAQAVSARQRRDVRRPGDGRRVAASVWVAAASPRRPRPSIPATASRYGFRLRGHACGCRRGARRVDAARDVRAGAARRLAGRAGETPVEPSLSGAPGVHAPRLRRRVRRPGGHGRPGRGWTAGFPPRGWSRSGPYFVVYTYSALRLALRLSCRCSGTVRDTAIVTARGVGGAVAWTIGRRRGRPVLAATGWRCSGSDGGWRARRGSVYS